jgi:hypothetical protein
VICSTGLWSLPADYHASNFYPQVEDRADARYGAFIQLWARRFGAGRMVAFSDSTIFSNFSTFEPGKAELMLGMLEWLNHRNGRFDLRPWLLLMGVALMALGIKIAITGQASWLLILCAGWLGWAMAMMGIQFIHHSSMPSPRPSQSFVHVVIDRTVCDAQLSKSGFIAGKADGFGIFERWILRLGYFTSRRSGDDALIGDVLVFMHPHHKVSRSFRNKLADYVASGGKVLILDGPENADSTANSLLYPFRLSVDHSSKYSGELKGDAGLPLVIVDEACSIKGGQPILWLGQAPAAARFHYGRGTVTVIGFANRFDDLHMGVTGDVIPDNLLRSVYDLQFAILKDIVQSR